MTSNKGMIGVSGNTSAFQAEVAGSNPASCTYTIRNPSPGCDETMAERIAWGGEHRPSWTVLKGFQVPWPDHQPWDHLDMA